VAVGDFNGAGKLDVAVANLGSGNVSILLGNGDGTLRAPVNYATGDSPNSIAVADFNGDGKLDLAVVNGGNNTGVSSLSILLGNGDGTFNSVAKYLASFGNSVAVGDFNQDGKLDVAVANFGSSSVGVLLGNGDGTFKTAVNYVADNASSSVAAGDFNGDGKLDLAVANIVSNSGLGDVSVLVGNGDGTFRPPVNYGVGSNPSSVAVGDFNGDGKLDMAVANLGGYGNIASLSVLLGNGNGSFQPAMEYISASARILRRWRWETSTAMVGSTLPSPIR
jgi:FG-GAP-like repeat